MPLKPRHIIFTIYGTHGHKKTNTHHCQVNTFITPLRMFKTYLCYS